MSTTAPALDSDRRTPSSPAWKEELHERLREHKQRRAGDPTGKPDFERSGQALERAKGSDVAARVAERWKRAPSYEELLAESAIAAKAAATAALQAHAAAEAALAAFTQPVREQAADRDSFTDPFFSTHKGAPVPAGIEHHAPLPECTPVPARTPTTNPQRAVVDAFAEAIVPPAESLPAKLIEFPRELVAPQKQRPRLAEGPLLEEAESTVALRIFEVDEPVSQAHTGADARAGNRLVDHEPPVVPARQDSPARRRGGFFFGEDRLPARETSGWDSIQLGEHPQAVAEAEAHPQPARRPDLGYKAEAATALEEIASLGDRLMAALVDGSIVSACLLLSVWAFAAMTTIPLAGKGALAAALLALGVLGTFYGWLFLRYGGGATPGMRYARIALCTFAGENPTRKQLRNRIPATALALLPLGLGLVWALLDEDKLGWHDRMTRTYQRSYR